MSVINENDLIKEGRKTDTTTITAADRRQFQSNAILMGGLAGLVMSIFLAFTGFYISGDNAGIGFAKYIILGIALGALLGSVKRNTPTGETFSNGMEVGLKATAVSAIVLSVMTLIINSFGETATIQPYFKQSSGEAMSTIVLAGITLVETFVAGMILTFIWLQFLKDKSDASETVDEVM